MEPERRRLLVRRPLLPCGVRELVSAERGHVQAEVAEDVERLVEPLVGVALLGERADERPALVQDPLLEFVAHALDVRSDRSGRSRDPRARC